MTAATTAPTDGVVSGGKLRLLAVCIALVGLLLWAAPPDMHPQSPAASLQAAPGEVYTNPVWPRDFPDPHIVRWKSRFYAYATHAGPGGFQVMESSDLIHWTHRGGCFEPPWSREHLWAPEVIERRGKLYMTYSATNPQTGKHDIGVAVATNPLGPFEHKAILVRAGNNRVGVIDTTVFFDGGRPYLLYTEEEPRRIVMRSMADDLLSVRNDVTVLVAPDQPRERGVTEAPTLVYRNGVYHLFFSIGWFQSNKADACYAVAHATSRSLRGPYVKSPDLILETVPDQVYGPGHQCIVTLPGGAMWMAYHAWDARNEPRYGSNPAGRTLRVDRIGWRGDRPFVSGPTVTPQPCP
jgi:beta-xylosidase